jgi:TolB-like protein
VVKYFYGVLKIAVLIICGFFAFRSADVHGAVQGARTPAVIAVLPFSINAEKDLGFLREGIMDMLMTRLYWKGKVSVIEKDKVKGAVKQISGPFDLEKAGDVGKRLGADYVLFGSLTIFGESVSVDATMASITKNDPPVTVFVQTKGMESVIPEINTFAQKVNSGIFGRSVAETEAPARGVQVRAGQDRGSGLNPNFTAYDSDAERASFWKSRAFNSEIMGMDIGDVNGDGLNELILIEETVISVYSFKEGTLARLAGYEAEDRTRFIWIDAADINGNGRAEIFASKATGSSISSVVLEMEGGKLKPVVNDSSWFYRVMDWPGLGKILLGQQRMVGSHTGEVGLTDAFFVPGIFRLVWKGKDYEKEGALPLLNLKGIYVFNFVVGRLGKDPTPFIVAVDWYEKLRLLTMTGEEIHKTSDYYGGTLNYVMTSDTTRHETLRRDSFYIPARLLITDVDKDGSNELIVNQNKSTTLGMTERLRAFSDGKIVALTWDGVSFTPVWESRKLQGCLSSFQIKDLDNDAKDELVVSMIHDRGVSLLAKARSSIISYRLEQRKDQADVK